MVAKNGNWPSVKADSYVVVAAIDPKRFLYCVVVTRTNDRLAVISFLPDRKEPLVVKAQSILFQITKQQFDVAKKMKFPQTSEAVMKIVNWSRGGSS